MSEKIRELREKAMNLPLSPGVYIMKNKSGEVIYIGKAKFLKNRVSSYFGSDKGHGEKVKRMVENVHDFDYILVDSEYEALVLECSLIKQHKPKYNILLKDDKGYHYIKVTRGDWRMISASMQKPQDGSEIIGPFTGYRHVADAVEQACRIYKLPTCGKVFPRDLNKGRPCLKFHIGHCAAPCAGKIRQKDYAEAVDSALRFILNGSTDTVRAMREEMEDAAERLDFERAAKLRDRIAAIEKIGQKQKVVSQRVKDQDIFAIAEDRKSACLMVLRFAGGNLYDSEYFFVNGIDSLPNARMQLILSYYSMRDHVPPRVTVDGEVEDAPLISEHLSKKAGRRVALAVPERGEQAALVSMCRSNAFEKLAQQTGREGKRLAALDELAELLGLAKAPAYIESYDISHTAGSDNVAGMVVFLDGKPYKKAYKRFMIKGFEGQDDYASMNEVLSRRLEEYQQHKESGEGFGRLPDLILLDGGIGQVNAVRPLLLQYHLDIPLFGMVKDSKHKTRAVTSDGGEIAITSKRKAFTLVSEIQEEVHRFAVTYHRKKHAAKNLRLSLRDVEGVGESRAKTLLAHFKTIKAVSAASVEELASVKGISRKTAENIHRYYQGEPMKNTIIFDMDGTLLNTLDDLMDSVNYCLEKRGFPLRTLDEIRSFVGNGIGKLIERAVPAGTSKADVEDCTREMIAYYKDHSAIKTAPYEGVLDLLKTLNERGIKTAVVTNKEQDIAQVLCADTFLGLFTVVVGAREDLAAKPAPDGVLEAMKALQVSAEECLFVGDSEVDIETAKNAGLASVGVLWGFRDQTVLEEAGADYLIASVDELSKLVLAE